MLRISAIAALVATLAVVHAGAASAIISANGTADNGIRANGVKFNGIHINGIKQNGVKQNGSQGASPSGASLIAIELPPTVAR